MNKKNALFVGVIIFIASFFFGAVSQAQVNNAEIFNVYKKALELNEGRFADPNLIYVGDYVLFPAYYGPGVVAYIADSPSDGKHDSFWRLSEKYVARQLVIIPADTTKVVASATVTPPVAKKELATLYNWLILVIALIVLGVFLIFVFDERKLFKRPGNANNYPPVGGNIDALPREQTLASVMTRFLFPGEKLISFRRGTLGNNLGQSRFSVNMAFGDNVPRDVWMNSGERVSTAIIKGRNGKIRTQHIRNACFNGFGGGSFELPNGWFIQYDESEEVGRVVTEDDGQGGQRLVPMPTVPVSKEISPSTNFSNLMEAVKNMKVSAGSSIDISYKEKGGEIELSIRSGLDSENEL